MAHLQSLPSSTRRPGSSNGAAGVHATDDERSGEIAIIAHELRNSLTVIRGAVRLLGAPASPGSAAGACSLIDRHAGLMSRHIEDLLQPQPRNGRSHGLRLLTIDLRTIARFAIDAIGPEMARRRHRFAVQLPEESVWAQADGARLEQAFSNLLINAAKFTPDGGVITFSMASENDQVRVRVSDSGIGIEASKLPRLFGMFVQVGTDLPGREHGCGIGLAVVRNVIEQHGGTVTATSAGLGLGSEFAVVLPTLWAQRASVIVTP